MAKQSVRNCVTLSANELVSKLVPVDERKEKSKRKVKDGKMPLKTTSAASLHASTSDHGSPHSTPTSSPGKGPDSGVSPDKKVAGCNSPRSDSDLSTDSIISEGISESGVEQQIVIIDLRTDEDTESNGGGTIAKAIRLDPNCLKDTEMLSKWLQHFDGIKGCVICVIDMPPVQAPEIALWRRLLLGEGDGYAPGMINYGPDDSEVLDVSQKPRDYQSPFAKLEEATLKDDLQRVGMKFALELQRNGFPYVSLLDGGFPSLIESLFNLRGTVEPVVIQHNVEAWQQYLRASGRCQVIMPTLDSVRSFDDNSSDGDLYASKRDRRSKKNSDIRFPIKKLKDMDELEKAKTAYRVALQLKHSRMAAILKIKISTMDD